MHNMNNYFKMIEQIMKQKKITKLDIQNIDKTEF